MWQILYPLRIGGVRVSKYFPAGTMWSGGNDPFQTIFFSNLLFYTVILYSHDWATFLRLLVGFFALCPGHTDPLLKKKLGHDFLTKISPKKFNPVLFVKICYRRTDKFFDIINRCVMIFSSS